jgi:hypothetical protein
MNPKRLVPDEGTVVQASLTLLLGFWRCATLLNRPPWDFACDKVLLGRTGLAADLLDHFLKEGYLECRPGWRPGKRDVQVVLTASGAAWARGVVGDREAAWPDGLALWAEPEKPQWDGFDRQLRYQGCCLLHFVRRAPNQEGLLAAFQEQDWVARIDDPLPKVKNVDPVDRLYDTVKHLNERQRPRKLVFRLETDGRGVGWRPRT